MREANRHLLLKRQLETIDAEIAYCGLQIKKLHKAFQSLFPMRSGGRGWTLAMEKCYGERAKKCRSCPHNLYWVRYYHVDVKNVAAKTKSGRPKKYQQIYDKNSHSNSIPWDYIVKRNKFVLGDDGQRLLDKEGNEIVRIETENLGFKRRSPEMRKFCKQIQKMKDRIMTRRKKLLDSRMMIEATLRGLSLSSAQVKETLGKEFEILDTLAREYKRKRDKGN